MGTDLVDYPACRVSPTAPPASLSVDPFYGKYLDAHGIPVLSSVKVADQALAQACVIVSHMVSFRDDYRQALISNRQRVAVMAISERTTDIPEYRDLNVVFPGSNYDQGRAIGATLQNPLTAAGEESLLCPSAGGKKLAANLVWSFSAGSVATGMTSVDSTFPKRLQTAYDDATSAGRFSGLSTPPTQASDYFGQGVDAWLGGNPDLYASGAADAGLTAGPEVGAAKVGRAQLRANDAALAALIAEWMPSRYWRDICH